MTRAGRRRRPRSALGVLGPQAQPGLRGRACVAGHHVELGVVEQRVLVEVGRADRQPAVVDDADLRVHIDRRRCESPLRPDGVASSRPAPPSASSSRPSWPRVVSGPLLGLRGSTQQTEVVASADRELVGEHVDDLRRPQELVLQVDEPLRGAQRAQVGLEDAEVAARREVVGASRARCARPGRSRSPAGGGAPARAGLAGDLVPARRKCARHRRRRARAGARDVVPAEAARGVVPRVSKRSPSRAVKSMPPTKATSPSTTTNFSWWQCSRALAGVEHAVHLRVADELVAARLHLCAWAGTPAGAARPRAGRVRHALCHLGQQVAQA